MELVTIKKEKYTSYSIAESYREGKIIRRQKLFTLGRLSEIKLEQTRLILKVIARDSIKKELARLKIARFFQGPHLANKEIQTIG